MFMQPFLRASGKTPVLKKKLKVYPLRSIDNSVMSSS